MVDIVNISAERKEQAGTGAARAFRRDKKVPAIIYGGEQGEVMCTLPINEFVKVHNRGDIQSYLFEIELDGKVISAVTREVQLDPVTDVPLHVDFQEVGKNTVIKVMVRLRTINDDKAPGLKRGGVLNVAHRYIEFRCHPRDMVHQIVIDLAGLEIGQNIHINDIALPQGMTPVDESNFVLVSLTGRGAEKAAASAEGGEGEDSGSSN